MRFFHWHLEFPEVFANGGFHIILGNPPWETLQQSEVDFLTANGEHLIASLAGARRKAAFKEKLTADLDLADRWATYQHDLEATTKSVRGCGRFPLTTRGKLNTYALFAELGRAVAGTVSRVGILVPIGIATDDANKHFFSAIASKSELIRLVGFENEEFIFPDVHHSFKFCGLTFGPGARNASNARFVFFCRKVEDINDRLRQFELSASDIALLNPISGTCPIFRTREDAELTKKIYQRVPILSATAGVLGWQICLRQGLFNMTTDSDLFQTNQADDTLPLYEAKMIHQFDHR